MNDEKRGRGIFALGTVMGILIGGMLHLITIKGYTETHVGEIVNVVTEQGVKEYRVDEYVENYVTKEYRISPEEYGTYESCVRGADGLYIPCPNRIMLSEEEFYKIINKGGD